MMFVYDKCRIPGKKNPTWRIINTTDDNFEDIYFKGKYLTYLFQVKGKYTINLELEDTNGNIKSVTKNSLIIQ
jgi:PKD repeat protein